MSAGRALVVAPRLPEFDRESGLLRVSHLIEMLQRRGWSVTFACLRTPTDRDRYVRVLQQSGVETYAPLKSLDSIHGGDFDLALLCFWHVAERFLPELRRASPETKIVVDSVDLHFLRDMRDQLRSGDGAAPRQVEPGLGEALIQEMNTYAAADAVLTVSEKEAALINDLVNRQDLAFAVPDADELPRSPVPMSERRGILFLGNFLHAPNCDAASYLCGEILPRIDPSLLAEHQISIVGTGAEDHVSELAARSDVKTVGWVPSVLPYINAARITVVPLRYGAGTKRKVIQALMAGTPTVTTSVGAEGLGLSNGREVLIADDPDSFAAAIERLLLRRMTWRRLSRRGRRHILRLHGRETVETRFERVLEAVLSRPTRPAVDTPDVGDGIPRAPEYARLVARVRQRLESELPANAQVLVASRGDDGLLAQDGPRGWHFPRDREGRYSGHYPADSAAAIDHLEALRTQGATHLALPQTAFWWLAYYEDFNQHLESRYRRLLSDEELIVYDLKGEGSAQAMTPTLEATPAVAEAAFVTAPPAASEVNGRPADGTADEITPDLLRELQPAIVPVAARYREGRESRPRALVLGIYLADKPNTAPHVAATLARSNDVDVCQKWVALGEAGVGEELAGVTALQVHEPTPKYALLNRLLAEEDLSGYDFVLVTDDDIVLPDRFLDHFLGVQAGIGFALAQPARTLNSHVDHPIVLQQRGVVARRTLFVEIGPLVSFSRDISDLLLPFDETSPMGWGFENVWAHVLRERGKAQGIVDAVPMDHSVRAPVAYYEWEQANAGRERYLARHEHLADEECFRVLEVVGPER